MGTTALRTVQFGRETTWGTSVAATAIMSGVMDVTARPRVVTVPLNTLTGSLAPATGSILTSRSAGATISGLYTPEDFIYIGDSAIRGSVTPTGSGPYVYTQAFGTTTTGALRSRTIEFYDGQQEWEMDGSLVESFKLSGEAGEDGFVEFESEWIGQDLTASTLTGSLSTRTYNAIPANSVRLYVDAYGGPIGSTELANTLISWEFAATTGIHLKKFGSATVTPDSYGYSKPEITLTLTLEYNANGDTQLDNHVAGTQQLFRLTGSGASSTALSVDMAGIPTGEPELWGDRDGNTTITLEYTAVYDPGAFANYARIISTNNVSAFVTGA